MGSRGVRVALGLGAVALCLALLAPAAGAFTFTQAPGSPYPVGAFAYSAAVGDFNGDGLSDFAAAVNSPAPSNPGGTASVSVAGGGRDRRLSVHRAAGPTRHRPSWAREAARSRPRTSTATDVSTLRRAIPRTCGRSWATATERSGRLLRRSPTAAPRRRLVTADFNGDHKPDLAVLNGDSTVSVFLGNGDGTFTEAPGSAVAAGASAITVGDFNGDGKPDLAGITRPKRQALHRRPSRCCSASGDGSFRPAPDSPMSDGRSVSIDRGSRLQRRRKARSRNRWQRQPDQHRPGSRRGAPEQRGRLLRTCPRLTDHWSPLHALVAGTVDIW